MHTLKSLLASLENPNLPKGLRLGRSNRFDAIARIACQITGRSRAAIYVHGKTQEIVLGATSEITKGSWPRELPTAYRSMDIVDLPDAMKELGHLASVNGAYSKTAGLTVVGLKNNSDRIGEIVIADSVKKGPLSDAQKQSLLLLATVAEEQIEMSTELYLLASNFVHLLDDEFVAPQH